MSTFRRRIPTISSRPTWALESSAWMYRLMNCPTTNIMMMKNRTATIPTTIRIVLVPPGPPTLEVPPCARSEGEGGEAEARAVVASMAAAAERVERLFLESLRIRKESREYIRRSDGPMSAGPRRAAWSPWLAPDSQLCLRHGAPSHLIWLDPGDPPPPSPPGE